MPTYMSLWSMLISYQVCTLVASGSGTIPLISRIAGTIAMTIMGPGTALSLSLWCILLVCSYRIVCSMGAILLLIIYPWAIKKNYTLRWRRLLLYGGQSYRTILLCFAWLFQARPLYIACFFTCLCTMSKLAITSPMKRHFDPLEILRDIRQGGSIINLPIPHVILPSLCNLVMGHQFGAWCYPASLSVHGGSIAIFRRTIARLYLQLLLLFLLGSARGST